ncbi:MAG: transglutaminase-like domain-containing protein [Phycisphaeraceae bacterium]
MTQTPTRPARATQTTATTTQRLTLAIEEAFERAGHVRAVRYDDERGGVAIDNRMLIEDDGPGIGGDAGWQRRNRAPLELVAGRRQLRKILHIENATPHTAHLVARGRHQNTRGESAVGRMAGDGLMITLNGTRLDGSGEVDAGLLKSGDNELIITCPADRPHLVKYARAADIIADDPARADRPRRSFRSVDGGRTWEPIDGELMLRLHLIQHASRAELISPVLEPATSAGLRRAAAIAAVELDADMEQPEGTSIELTVRTGTTPAYDAATWSDWRPAGRVAAPGQAFVQWRACLSTRDGRVTPLLRGVTASVALEEAPAAAWARGLAVRSAHNADVRCTGLEFVHEDFNHARLAALRSKYHLDDVVAGAGSELERFVRLRNWVANQWSWDPPVDHYPAWDADEILQRRQGFCVQFAIVYLQACLSLGHPARFVFGYHPGPDGGHEVVEVWSGEFDKWVLMDPNVNEHYVDPDSNTPLGMLEVHERMIRRYYPAGRTITIANRPAEPLGIEDIATCRGLDLAPSARQELDLAPSKWPRWAKWGVIRMVPRSDFYSREHPLPRVQGANWDWPHYLVWEGAQADPGDAYRYRRITRRRADWNWSLNHVRFDAAPGDEPGAVDVQLATVTPGFETFEVRENDGAWRAEAARFTWRLRRGGNRLEMRTRNVAGVTGAASHIELDYRADAVR